MSKVISPTIINSASLGYGLKKKLNDCPDGFVQSETGCIQNCPSKKYLNNICRCNLSRDCPYGFTCLNNLCLSTDEICPDNHKKEKNICIQECKYPKNKNGPICKCESNNDCNLGQECNTKFKHCIIKEESLNYPLGISPNFEAEQQTRQEMKNKNTYNIWALLPVVVTLLVYYVIKKLSFPLSGLASELLIIVSVLITNYKRFSKICTSKIFIFGTIRKSVIILGLSSLLLRLFTVIPPMRSLISNVGLPVIGWITSISTLIIFLINNHLDDKLEGEDYDCDYILGVDTIKDIKQPLNIVFLVSLFMICVRIYFAFVTGTRTTSISNEE